jgi:hypothetical protein
MIAVLQGHGVTLNLVGDDLQVTHRNILTQPRYLLARTPKEQVANEALQRVDLSA